MTSFRYAKEFAVKALHRFSVPVGKSEGPGPGRPREIRRVLVYSRRYPPDVRGGAETVIDALVGQARQSGLDLRLVAGWQRSSDLLPDDADAIDLRQEVGAGLLQKIHLRLRAAGAVAASVRSFRPDVILSNSVELPPLPVPSVLIAHDFAFGRSADEPVDPGVHARELGWRLAALHVSRCVAVSEVTRARLLELGWPEDRVVVVRGGVNLERFAPAPLEASPTLRLVMVSRLVREKGAQVAIDAVRRLVALDVDVALVVAGAVEDAAWLAAMRVQALGLPVSFVPDPPDVVPLIGGADVVLFPTLVREGLGLAAIEAMACGKPVVHSDDPAVCEATAGVGVVTPRGDAEALATAIQGLARDADRRAALGAQGRALCEARYGWPTVFAAYRRVLEDAALTGRRGRP